MNSEQQNMLHVKLNQLINSINLSTAQAIDIAQECDATVVASYSAARYIKQTIIQLR